MKKLNQTGSHLIAVVVGIVVIAVIGFVAMRVMKSKQELDAVCKNPACSIESPGSVGTKKIIDTASPAKWSHDGKVWKANGTPLACPDPLTIATPVDISLATAILYPGQTRGTDYKPHGGFIFNGSINSDITVKVPIDAQLDKGSRYIEQGETQYYFVFIAPCGLMYKFDHLLTLSSQFQAYADKLPEAKPDDSRTTKFAPAIYVKKDDVVAPAVGFKNTKNVSVDFGVYDIRQPNAVSKTADWQQKHPNDNEFGAYGICWLDILSSKDAATAKALPGGDGVMGKTSDYCK